MYLSVAKRPIKLLKEPLLFWEFYIGLPVRILKLKIFGIKDRKLKLGKRRMVSMERANDLIYEGLMSDKPFALMRNGSVECFVALNKIFIDLGVRHGYSGRVLYSGRVAAGIFPASKEVADKFSQAYLDAMTQADLAVYWRGVAMCEKYFLRKYSKDAVIIPSRSLEPLSFNRPWSLALKNKKVLVIHHLADTIEKQYLNRDKLFKNPDILPEFKLKTIKAVQSSADNQDCGFDSWVDALEYMKKQIDEADFDVAILGCGAYAMPLAAYIKRMGKKAVVLGGFTQILFGIKGARWEASRPDIVALYNDYWVRPDEKDRPKGFDKVEEGAYW
ncbi:MAG: hypothetical protein WCX81_05100 [Monoglobales bacterium]